MPITRVRRLPTENDAVRWTGSNFAEVEAFLGKDFAGYRHWFDHATKAPSLDQTPLLLLHTMEHRNEPFAAPPGSWLLRGVLGEHWAVDAEVFARTYEPLEAAR
ncbi:hypothetical protein [Streptacidiphilus carbonis]|uniref:hypothetical protein n=1 Tax=Streptacidiphilus carbonis TaxID=105422 RepID=UPI0005AA65E3|nr:hypothetical protein [Streptacidiphilus carbonis]